MLMSGGKLAGVGKTILTYVVVHLFILWVNILMPVYMQLCGYRLHDP